MSRFSTILGRADTSGMVPFELWRQNAWCNRDVAGESHHEQALRAMLPEKLPERAEIDTIADLVPEPSNRHDRNAVAIRVAGQEIGYLPKEDAVRYQQMLLALVARRLQPRVPCTIRGWEWPEVTYDRRGRESEVVRFQCNVRIALDEPHLCVPVNLPPSARHLLIPEGHAIQVTGEEHHLDAIAPFLRPEGAAWAYATVHATTERRKIEREVIEVRLDNQRVGQLTPKMSGEILPAVRHLEASGITSAVKAIVRGNRLKSEVTLYVVRAHELPADWPGEIGALEPTESVDMSSVDHPSADERSPVITATEAAAVEHRPIPSKPDRVRFNPPPGWPLAPPGWEPSTGWQPPSDWPAAPPDWHYWVGDVALFHST